MTASSEPARSVEVELTFDVDAGTPLPDLVALPGVASVTAGELRSLDALYLDTADLALSAAGVALRRRTGGPDAGWHIKGPLVDGARVELHWPAGEPGVVPAGAREELARLTDAATLGELTPLARIRNERVAYHLLDADGEAVAEFVDDHVRAADVRGGVDREWREWELELGPAAPADHATFFAAASAAAAAVGARPAGSASKLARALGR